MGLKPGTRECPVPYKHNCAMPEIGPLWGMIRHVEPRTYYQNHHSKWGDSREQCHIEEGYCLGIPTLTTPCR